MKFAPAIALEWWFDAPWRVILTIILVATAIIAIGSRSIREQRKSYPSVESIITTWAEGTRVEVVGWSCARAYNSSDGSGWAWQCTVNTAKGIVPLRCKYEGGCYPFAGGG